MTQAHHYPHTAAIQENRIILSVDKKNQQDVTLCILYLSSNSRSTCFGQPCTHHQELTTAWCYSLVLVCAVAATNRSSQPPYSHGTYQHEAITSRSRQLLMMGTWLRETCWATIRREIKNTKKWHLVGFSYPHWITMHGQPHIGITFFQVGDCHNRKLTIRIQADGRPR